MAVLLLAGSVAVLPTVCVRHSQTGNSELPAQGLTRSTPAELVRPESDADIRDSQGPANERLPDVAPTAASSTNRIIVEVAHEADGEPVYPFTVYLATPSSSDLALASTDSNGVATFETAMQGRMAVRGETGGATEFVVHDQECRVQLRIPPGTDITVVVVDELGAPVPNATVRLSSDTAERDAYPVAITGGDGTAALIGVDKGRCVSCEATGFIVSRCYPVSLVDPQRRLVVRLRSGAARVHGRVVDCASGRPLSGVAVRIGSMAKSPSIADLDASGRFLPAPPPQKTVTDENGEFDATGLPHGSVDVNVQKAGYVGVGTVCQTDKEAVICLSPGPALKGVVTDGDGTPVVDVLVELGHFGDADYCFAYTDVAGGFSVADATRGEHAFTARDRIGRGASGTVRVPSMEKQLVIMLSDVGVVRGRLTSHIGSPLVGWEVYWTSEVPANQAYRRPRAQAVTDSDGSFGFSRGAMAGGWIVMQPRESGALFPSVSRYMEAEATHIDIQTEADEEPFGYILVDRISTSGEAVGGTIRVGEERSQLTTTVTLDAGGPFRIGPLRPGRYRVECCAGTEIWRAADCEIMRGGPQEIHVDLQ